jgi:hypothetical protein
MHNLILEAFLIMPLSLYRTPLNSILGSQKMPLNVDIRKNASKDLLLPCFSRRFNKCLKRSLGVF